MTGYQNGAGYFRAGYIRGSLSQRPFRRGIKSDATYVFAGSGKQPAARPYRDNIETMRGAAKEYPQIWHLFAFRPQATQHLAKSPRRSCAARRPLSAVAGTHCGVHLFPESLSLLTARACRGRGGIAGQRRTGMGRSKGPEMLAIGGEGEGAVPVCSTVAPAPR
jgi:hypothetical protein